jgi:hypothetical protein
VRASSSAPAAAAPEPAASTGPARSSISCACSDSPLNATPSSRTGSVSSTRSSARAAASCSAARSAVGDGSDTARVTVLNPANRTFAVTVRAAPPCRSRRV